MVDQQRAVLAPIVAGYRNPSCPMPHAASVKLSVSSAVKICAQKTADANLRLAAWRDCLTAFVVDASDWLRYCGYWR